MPVKAVEKFLVQKPVAELAAGSRQLAPRSGNGFVIGRGVAFSGSWFVCKRRD